jgi:DNA-binding MarR family transcriptional regulator
MSEDLGILIREFGSRMKIVRTIHAIHAEAPDVSEKETFLLELLRQRRKMTISEMRRFLPGIAESTMSVEISKLSKRRGWVRKSINPDNERERLVELTSKGLSLLSAMNEVNSRSHAILMRAIKMTPQEAEVCASVLRRAVPALDREIEMFAKSEV